MKKTIIHLVFFCLSLLFSTTCIAQKHTAINYTDTNKVIRAGKYLSVLEDTTGELTINDVASLNSFVSATEDIPNFGITNSTYWAKLVINNNTDVEDFIVEFEKVIAQELVLYYKKDKSSNSYYSQDAKNSFKKYSGRLFLFDIELPRQKTSTLYIKFKTNWINTFPVKIGAREKTLHRLFNEELIKGIYIGILFIMVFYNMFIYFSIRDKSYIYYVIYIFSFLVFQLNELGYTYKYLLYSKPELHDISSKLLPSISCIAAVYFVRDFLQTKIHTPKLDFFYKPILVLLICSLGLSFWKESNQIYFTYINTNTLITSLYTLFIAIVILRKGFQPAKYFLIAWCVLLLSIMQYNLSNLGILPYFPITDHSLEIGSVIEIFLLSLGLAYRINELKKEKVIAQTKELSLIAEKKNIIENQNQVLEKLVSERTQKLERRNKIINEKNEEKSIMMREIHHRVKNNLQMINSMVRLQSRYLNKENAIDSLKDVEQRILTMALLHEKMYQSENLTSIDTKEYISSVLKDIFSIFDNQKNITYSLEVAKLNFNAETILYLGLLIHELTTNSLKHAFKEQKNGFLKIYIHKISLNQYALEVTNNGTEISMEKFNHSDSLGQRLIKNFVKQLNGTLNIESNVDTTTFAVVFNED